MLRSPLLPRIALVALGSIALSALSGCIIHADSHVQKTGRVVGPQTLAQITPGKDKAFVIALLGEPSSTTALEGGTEIWKWTYSEKRVHRGSLIFVFDTDETTERSGATYVQFENEAVAKSWQD
jgi:outer membrane protein assembly factor BamE (lipoprotein component of BamABCDE complex)